MVLKGIFAVIYGYGGWYLHRLTFVAMRIFIKYVICLENNEHDSCLNCDHQLLNEKMSTHCLQWVLFLLLGTILTRFFSLVLPKIV